MRAFLVKNLPFIACAVLSVNFAIALTALVKINASNKIYTIGVNRLTESFTHSLNGANLSRDEQSAQVVNFGKSLEAALHEVKANGKVLLMEEAVLSGGIDITSQVVERIKKGIDKNA